MSDVTILTGGRIFDGEIWRDRVDLVVGNGTIAALVPAGERPAGATIIDLGGDLVAPGFIDLQVNGGGGVLLNDAPDIDTIRRICAAHAQFGSTALLPTLITDRPDITRAAMEAGAAALAAGVPGYAGLHLEGPHLSIKRKGAHDPALIRPMQADDLAAILEAKRHVGALLITIAPENVTLDQVSAMASAGIIVSLGHSDCSAATAKAYFAAGAATVTHLFNAMSPLGHREPGLVGALLDTPSAHAGLIADGFHVDPVSMGIALRAKRGPGRIFLVTDAMSTIGADCDRFTLNGRTIYRSGGRLTLEDGTLAGADIDMLASVRFLTGQCGMALDEALRMASLYPARAAGLDADRGTIRQGSRADLLIMKPDLQSCRVMIGGAIAG